MALAIRRVLILLGVMIALLGFGADVILPGSSPGLNLPQLLMIGAGVALAFGAHAHKRVQSFLRTKAGWHRSALTLLVILVLTLLALEVLLGLAGMSAYYAPREPVFHGRRHNCEQAVCRFRYDLIAEACARGEKSGRSCIVNRQGFGDVDEFVAREDFAERIRILMLGDSFTYGMSANVGNSFVETLEARYPDAIVWNGGLTNTGTNQAVATYKMLAPILQPQLTMLGFFTNDFRDNLVPIDSWFIAEDQAGETIYLRKYHHDPWGNLIPLDDESMRYFMDNGVHRPPNELERVLGSLQLGTLILRLRDAIALASFEDTSLADGLPVTREHLRQLRDFTFAHSSELLILLIPHADDLKIASEKYIAAVGLMEELGLPYVNVREELKLEDYAPPEDGHWNDAGHQKVGKIIGDCLQLYFESGNIGDCDYVVLPE